MTTTTSATSGTTSTSTTSSTTKTNQAVLNTNFDTFLKMLTTQLQYQDPTSPMDTAQFTNQLVMYSQVEQQISTNDKLGKLLDTQNSYAATSSIGYLGYDVKTESSALPLQNKSARFVVEATGATDASVAITDTSTGKIVRSLTLKSSDLGKTMVWDGKDANGNQLADGAYALSVAAKGADGKSITPTISTFGVVTGVTMDANNNSMLQMGKVTVSPSKVRSVNYYAASTTDTAA